MKTETKLKNDVDLFRTFFDKNSCAISLIVVINLLNSFIMFDICACMWSAL